MADQVKPRPQPRIARLIRVINPVIVGLNRVRYELRDVETDQLVDHSASAEVLSTLAACRGYQLEDNGELLTRIEFPQYSDADSKDPKVLKGPTAVLFKVYCFRGEDREIWYETRDAITDQSIEWSPSRNTVIEKTTKTLFQIMNEDNPIVRFYFAKSPYAP